MANLDPRRPEAQAERSTRNRPPASLYKYQPFSDQTLANLANAQLWFTAPIRFNDPFDCALPFFDLTALTDEDYTRAYTIIKKLLNGRGDR